MPPLSNHKDSRLPGKNLEIRDIDDAFFASDQNLTGIGCETDKDFVQNVLEHFKGILVKATVEGKSLVISGDVERITGYKKAELEAEDQVWASLIHPEDLNLVKDEINQLISIPNFLMKLEFRIVRKDGETAWVNVVAKSRESQTSKSLLIQAAIFDITGRKNEALHAAEVEKRKALRQTAAGVAHNFNNLLQVILSSAQLIDSDIETGNFSEVRETLDLIVKNCRLGSQIVKRLGVFSGTIQDYTNLGDEFFDVAEAAAKALAHIDNWRSKSARESAKEITLHSEIGKDLHVRGSKNQIARVIAGLVKNSFEAIQSKGSVSLVAGSSFDTVFVEIADSGAGIAAVNQDKIFDPFFSTKTKVGSGLGLPVALKIVEDCGGTITFRSSELNGSVFRIELPMVRPIGSATTQMNLGAKKILLIDDDRLVLNLLKREITQRGYDVDVADKGVHGLTKFRNKPFDAILCDLVLPEMNGLEISREIKKICFEKDISKPLFVILTGMNVDNLEKDKFSEFGVDEVLQKPVEIDNIISLINSDRIF